MDEELMKRLQALLGAKPDATRVERGDAPAAPFTGWTRPNPPAPSIVDEALEMVKKHEGFSDTVYWDPKGKKWTIGHGTTGKDIVPGMAPWTRDSASNRARSHLVGDSAWLSRHNRLDEAKAAPGLLSAAYNTGKQGLWDLGVMGEAVAGNFDAAADSLLKARRAANGEILPGYDPRRADESSVIRRGR